MGKKTEFFEVKDSALIQKIFIVAARHHLPLTMWFKDNVERFDTRFSNFIKGMTRIQVPLVAEGAFDKFRDISNSLTYPLVMGSFQLDNVNFFFQGTVLDLPENKMISVSLPSSIFKMQRRSFLRIPFPRHIAPKVTIHDPLKPVGKDGIIKKTDILGYRTLDLSVGGLAIAATPDEKERFPVGQKVIDIHFKLKDVEIIVTGTVKFAKEMLNDQKKPMLKVGIQFDKLKTAHEQTLAQFTLEESRKMFTLLF